ncbi:4-hydroxy-2-oxoheptanedioate aldolase [Solirubrobacter pauli]|uniref:4-hydroxy-2-oxoheptanedioate aldolase n=1 Tax=Solirubrobacter pauli TaxID=166793 RepID=A0A660LC56_9ACTN|nr:aldolase/citrate lyase family protein [Solirubrobacter pauli]RKQ90614.1 4-hydroxy-2-oxoheptanedioate aldolase [Solirubrobacter pauli]
MTPMKARLAAGETLFGTFLTLGSPFAAESLGLLGWDWLLVDLEHGGGDESKLVGQLMGCSSAGVHALARVESDVRGRSARALDLGVEGIMCPQVNSAEQAEAWASVLHYGPAGSRGIAFFHRGARYGTDPHPVETARERTCGIAQIESPEAVEAVEEIAAIDGVDVLFVGPSDLSYSMGMFREFDRPEFRSAIERVNEAAQAAGKSTGIFLTSVDDVPAAVADGFQMIGIGSDGGYMMAAARDTLTKARSAL